MSLEVDEVSAAISEIYAISPEIAEILKRFESSY
jgi:hypothetical protein